MIIPMRCMSCGKPISHLWEDFKKRVAEGESPKEIMNELGVKRYCCRAQFMGHVDLLEEIARFKRG
jgi:DNA-directed RNA polymerase subunit N